MPTSHLAKSSFLRMLFPPSFREVEEEHLMRMWQGKSALSVRKELIYSTFSYYLVLVFSGLYGNIFEITQYTMRSIN